MGAATMKSEEKRIAAMNHEAADPTPVGGSVNSESEEARRR